MIDADRLIRQNRTKWRLISMREIREHLAGKGDGILYCIGERQERDLVRLAYELGKREGERNKNVPTLQAAE